MQHDLWDHDLGTPLILYDTRVRGERRKALAAMRTDGYLFMLDRKTGKPLFPVEERAVPQDAWEKSAATQPFPVGADGVGPRCVEEDMVPAAFVRLCYFDVIDERPNLMALVMTARSAPMSFDPGWTTVNAVAVAIAASTALPPARSTASPADAASG